MSSPRLQLLITFDYELFLGRNFSGPDDVLFAPTRRLLDLCARLEVPATFFADICSVWAHQRFSLNDYVRDFEDQLVVALKAGHDVQLHLHPHWLESTWENGEWRVSTDRMYLAELGFGDGPDAAPALIRRGVRYLVDLFSPHAPAYRCLAFRAAGLALQPDEGQLIAALLDAGIELDSSVIKGTRLRMDTVTIDYRRTPESANWRMSPEGGIVNPAAAGVPGLFEVPIATFHLDLLTRLRFLAKRLRSVGQMRGTGISRSRRQTRRANLRTLLYGNLRYLYANPWFVLSCDTKGFDLDMLLWGLDSYLARHAADRMVAVSMINHPKLMFDEQCAMLEAFVRAVRLRYRDDVSFVTCTQAAGLAPR